MFVRFSSKTQIAVGLRSVGLTPDAEPGTWQAMNRDELAAREGIRHTIARYAHCADSGRFDEMVSLFTEDGALEIDGRATFRGRAAILDFLTDTKKNLQADAERPFIRHHVSSVLIDLTAAGQAKASSYFFCITQRGPDHWGRYRDRFVLREGMWLFAHRRVQLDGRATK